MLRKETGDEANHTHADDHVNLNTDTPIFIGVSDSDSDFDDEADIFNLQVAQPASKPLPEQWAEAVQEKNSDALVKLLEKGYVPTDINALIEVENNKLTALHLAIENNLDASTIKNLLDKGANVTIPDQRNLTPIRLFHVLLDTLTQASAALLVPNFPIIVAILTSLSNLSEVHEKLLLATTIQENKANGITPPSALRVSLNQQGLFGEMRFSVELLQPQAPQPAQPSPR